MIICWRSCACIPLTCSKFESQLQFCNKYCGWKNIQILFRLAKIWPLSRAVAWQGPKKCFMPWNEERGTNRMGRRKEFGSMLNHATWVVLHSPTSRSTQTSWNGWRFVSHHWLVKPRPSYDIIVCIHYIALQDSLLRVDEHRWVSATIHWIAPYVSQHATRLTMSSQAFGNRNCSRSLLNATMA